MSSSFSTEFQIDGVNYLLSADCQQGTWPKLCDRVFRHLERIGKAAAQNQFGPASAVGTTKLSNCVVPFKLTVNPEGNPFR